MTSSTSSTNLLIRQALPVDRDAITRLARLDSRPVPAGPVLIAAVDGEIAAAVGIESGERIADPFRPTADLVELLTAHARRIRVTGPRPLARRLGLSPRVLART